MGNKEKLLWSAAFAVASFVSCKDGSAPKPTPLPIPDTPVPTQTQTPQSTSVPPIIESNSTSLTPESIPTTPPQPATNFKDHILGQHENRSTLNYQAVDWESLSLIDPVNVQQWEELILEYANKFDIYPEVIAAIIDTESHGRTDGEWAELEGDGVGLMGVMPQELGFPNRPPREELFDPETNIDWGTSIFWEILNNTRLGNGSYYQSLLWYNAGFEENLEFAIPYANNIYNKLGWEIPINNNHIPYMNQPD